MKKNIEQMVVEHYGKSELLQSILNGLKAAGADLDDLKIEDLAPVDEFHTAGRSATLKAFAHLPLSSDMHILDVGCGIGGAARVLAKEYHCQVTGIDVTPEFVEVANELNKLIGINDKCSFQIGSGTAIPFTEGTFDACISFHVAMNIEDREKLYAEMARVTKARGYILIFDIMQGPNHGLSFPVPWATTSEASFLKTPAETRVLIENAGFEIILEENLREFALQFFRNAQAKAVASTEPPAVGLHLLMGPDAMIKYGNAIKAAEAGQTEPVIMLAQKK